MPRPKPPQRAPWFRYTDAASVGIEMVVAITICALGALWLERNVTHWAPWTSILGILVGVGAAGKAVMRAARLHRPSAPAQGASTPANAAPDAAATASERAQDPGATERGDSG
ncbi:MAG TPA: AtpZ/AtpI family protein [Nannocystaceae bacterium]|nr:AtpZ/AtpI family protein [Nannocystaceae bacterium]